MADFGKGDIHGICSEEKEGKEKEKGEIVEKAMPPCYVTTTNDVTMRHGVTRCHAAELVATLLRQELGRSASNLVRRDLISERTFKFPFTKHTITFDSEGQHVDFRRAAEELEDTRRRQFWVAREIEMAKHRQLNKYSMLNEQGWAGPYSCTCSTPEPGDAPGSGPCYNCYNEDDVDIDLGRYAFNSAIPSYAHVKIEPMPEVSI